MRGPVKGRTGGNATLPAHSMAEDDLPEAEPSAAPSDPPAEEDAPRPPPCSRSGCGAPATHGRAGAGRHRTYACDVHAADGMAHLCLVPGCAGLARFGSKGGAATRCEKHKIPGAQTWLNRPMCEENTCPNWASFRLPDEYSFRWCGRHRPDNAVKGKRGDRSVAEQMKESASGLPDPPCFTPGCRARATVGSAAGGARVLACPEHASQTMVPLCERPGCRHVARYNYPHSKVGRLCIDHKVEGTLYIPRHVCGAPQCHRAAIFGDPAEGKRLYCETHRAPGNERIEGGLGG
ncbi:hypothetical protein DFJ74DRAFT_646821 [Hyaloraphidium curvatum]|nr:hypothetical protein DFJ74DRAFT_646821 [Hyaloraphidium curvatum]